MQPQKNTMTKITSAVHAVCAVGGVPDTIEVGEQVYTDILTAADPFADATQMAKLKAVYMYLGGLRLELKLDPLLQPWAYIVRRVPDAEKST